MKKLMSIAAAVACLCLTAQAERVTIDLSLSATDTNDVTGYVTGSVASITNWATVHGILVTIPATNSATLTFKTDVAGGSAQMGETLSLANGGTTPVVRFIVPSQIMQNSRNYGAGPLLVFSTNTSVTVKQAVNKTATWPVKIFVEQ